MSSVPPMNRCGSMIIDFVTAFAWLGVLGLFFVAVGQELRSDSRCDERRGRLEIGQNILDAVRHAQASVLPAGWRLTRQPLGGAVILVHVLGPQCDLGTLLPATAASAPAGAKATPSAPRIVLPTAPAAQESR